MTESTSSSTLAAVAEVLGVGSRHLGGAKPLERGDVARCDDDHALPSHIAPERPIDELTDLATAFPHQRDDDHVGLRPTRDCTEQRAFSNAGTRKKTHALTFTEREQSVDHAHPGRHRLRHGTATERDGRIAVDCDPFPIDRRPAVEGPPQPIDDAPEQRAAGAHLKRSARRLDLIVRSDSGKHSERHPVRLAAIEADDFARERRASSMHRHHIADTHPRHHEAKAQPRDAKHAARRPKGRYVSEFRLERLDVRRHRRAPLRPTLPRRLACPSSVRRSAIPRPADRVARAPVP